MIITTKVASKNTKCKNSMNRFSFKTPQNPKNVSMTMQRLEIISGIAELFTKSAKKL